MNKILLLFIFLLIIPFSAALTTDIRPTYSLKETMIIEIQGPIVGPISKDNVEFRRGHVLVPFDYDLLKLGNKYFVYAISNSPNNYTFVLKNVDTLINGQVQSTTLEQNFTIEEDTISYNIKPGAILAQSDFDITIFSFNDTDQIISIAGSPKTITPGENLLHFKISEFPNGFSTIQIGNYIVPIYAVKEPEPPIIQRTLVFLPERIDESFYFGKDRPVLFRIINSGNKSLSNIEITYDTDIFILSPKTIKKLDVNQSTEINLTLKQKNIDVTSTITINLDGELIEFPVHFSYRINETNQTRLNVTISQNTTGTSKYYCEELNGKVCSSGEECVGQQASSLNGICCLGTCTTKTSSTSSWIGYTLGAIVLIILIVVGARYWKSKKTSSSSDILKSKMNRLEKP